MDKSWMKYGRGDREYMLGIHSFVNFVRDNSHDSMQRHVCPCRKCLNQGMRLTVDEISNHLFQRGMMASYTIWNQHGEVSNIPTPAEQRRAYLQNRAFSSGSVEPSTNLRRGTTISGVGGCMRRSPIQRGGVRTSAPNEDYDRQLQQAREEARQAKEEAQQAKEEARQAKVEARHCKEQLAQALDQNKSLSDHMRFFGEHLLALSAASDRPIEIGSHGGSHSGSAQEVNQERDDLSISRALNADVNGGA